MAPVCCVSLIHLLNRWCLNGTSAQTNPAEHDTMFLEFACERLMCCGWCLWRKSSICTLFWLLRQTISFWLHFNCNEHLTLFQSNTSYVASPKGILSGSLVFNFPVTLPITAYVHLCGCVCIPLDCCVGLWVNSRHVWFKFGDCQSENVWMCDCIHSFTFGVVLVSVLYWCRSLLGFIFVGSGKKGCILTITS